jgi:hypothetical protein
MRKLIAISILFFALASCEERAPQNATQRRTQAIARVKECYRNNAKSAISKYVTEKGQIRDGNLIPVISIQIDDLCKLITEELYVELGFEKSIGEGRLRKYLTPLSFGAIYDAIAESNLNKEID